MRIEIPRYTERFGAVRINQVQKVLQLDSGRPREFSVQDDIAVRKIEERTLKNIEQNMAIVIHIKNESLKLFEGVVSGVPHECLIIVVSNSDIGRVNRFRTEKNALREFCRSTRRRALIVHQKNPLLARALKAGGYGDILGEDGLVRSGKAEGMVVAIMLAMMEKKGYIGFVDADNLFPGSVWEYVRCYAAGFSMAESPYAMVRILWRYKSKASADMNFRKQGRVSEIANICVNSLISANSGFDTDIIQTSSAGEHAMSLKLTEILPYATDYAVAPQELVSIFEGFGGVLPFANETAAKRGIEVFQIETRNPRLYEARRAEHLQGVLVPGMGSIFHSPLCEPQTRQVVLSELLQQGAIQPNGFPPKPHVYRPPRMLDLKRFTEAVQEHHRDGIR